MTLAGGGTQVMGADGKSLVKRTRLIFVGLLIAVSLLRIWFSTTLPLTGDEAYHWEWSRNLEGGYYDHPPMTACVIKTTTALLGSTSELGVRFGAIILLAGAAVVLYLLARRMARDSGISFENAERAGWTAGLLALVCPLFAGFGVYMSTDPPLIFFCSLSLLCSYLALTKGGWLPWIGVGVAVGLCLLSKFLCLFTFAGLFVFLVLSPQDRKWFLRPQPYVAALIAVAVFSPFLFWNHANEWATFKFNLVTRQSSNAFAPKHFPEFLISQMAAVSPIVMILGIVALFRAGRLWRSEKDRGYLYLLCAAAVPLLYFLFTSFRRRVGIHWPACGWIPVIVLLPLLHTRGRISLLWMRIMLWSCIALTILIHVTVSIPPWMLRSGQERFASADEAPAKFEDARFGWREMGVWVNETKDWFHKDQEGAPRGVFLMTGQYGVSAALSFYMPGQPKTHLWGPVRTHGENYRFWDDFPSLKDQDAIYVAKREKKAIAAIEVLKRHFTYVHEPEKLSIKVDGEEVNSFYLIKCSIYDGVEPTF